MKLSDPFRLAGFWFKAADWNFELTCTCGVTQRADALTKRTSGKVLLYDCPSCSETLIGVTAHEGPRLPGDETDAHYMMGFAFGSAVDMELWPAAATESWMDIPARPDFFIVYCME